METFRFYTKARGFKRQSAVKVSLVDVWIEFTQTKKVKDSSSKMIGGVVPREFIPAVEKGLQESMANGVLAGYPMVDVSCLRWFIPRCRLLI